MTRPLRIFFPGAPIEYPPTDGHHVHVYQLVKNLLEMGHEVTTLAPDKNPLPRVLPRKAGVVVKMIRWADVIYMRPAEHPSMPATLTALPYRLLIPSRTAVVWEQNRALTVSLYKQKRSDAQISRDIETFKRLAGRVDAAIGVTDLVTSQLRDLLGIRHSVTIGNGSDPQMFRPDLPPPAGLERGVGDPLRVAFIGSHANSVHDAGLIGAAAKLVDERGLPIRFHAIGKTGEMFADKPASLVLHGPVPYPQLPPYLAAMDVGLTLYNYKADGVSPLKLFDYLASGVVPVCSPGQPMETVLAEAGVGRVADWTAGTLVEELMRLHADRAALGTMRERARRVIETTHSWRRVSERVEGVMRSAIARRAKPRAAAAEATRV